MISPDLVTVETRHQAPRWTKVCSWELWLPSIFEWVRNRTKGYILSPFCLSGLGTLSMGPNWNQAQNTKYRPQKDSKAGLHRVLWNWSNWSDPALTSKPSGASVRHPLRPIKMLWKIQEAHNWTYNQSLKPIFSSCTILLRQSGHNAFTLHISPKITFHSHLKDVMSISKCLRNNGEEGEANTELLSSVLLLIWKERASSLWSSNRISSCN